MIQLTNLREQSNRSGPKLRSQLPVSIQICTLNEEANLEECLRHVAQNNAAEVIVIDGGSSDRTVAIAQSLGVTVIEAGSVGLAVQRRLGFQSTEQVFTAFIDADDRIPPNWLADQLEALNNGNYSALQSSLRAFNAKGFWGKGWDNYLQESVKSSADVDMVGRPALFTTESLASLNSARDLFMEDTQMSRQFQDLGLRQGISSVTAARICTTGVGENLAKWRKYGKGYREFVNNYPDRKKSIGRHIFWTIPVVRTLPAVKRGAMSQPLFGVLMASAIARGYFSRN